MEANDHPELLSLDHCKSALNKFTYVELQHLRTDITARMNEMRTNGITQLRATIAEQANLLGVELKDLVPRKPRKKRKSKDDREATD